MVFGAWDFTTLLCLHIHEILQLDLLYIHIAISHTHAEMKHTSSTEVPRDCVNYNRAQIYTAHTLEFSLKKKDDLFAITEAMRYNNARMQKLLVVQWFEQGL